MSTLRNDWPHSINPSKKNHANHTVGIVIPVRDGLKFLKLAIYSVLYFTDFPYSLIIVDNESGLTTKKYLRSLTQNHDISVLRFDEAYNFSAECNLGLKYAFSQPNIEYGLVLNADTIVEPNWLSKMVMAMNSSSKIGVVGPVSNIATQEQSRGRGNQLIKSKMVSGFCMMLRKQVFQDLGGFDENFKGGGWEDTDFCQRAQEKGWDSYINTEVFVHHFWKAFRRLKEHDEMMLKNRAYFYKKHSNYQEEER